MHGEDLFFFIAVSLYGRYEAGSNDLNLSYA